jgi:hypothetical protein
MDVLESRHLLGHAFLESLVALANMISPSIAEVLSNNITLFLHLSCPLTLQEVV